MKKTPHIVVIDPGKSGAIAFRNSDGTVEDINMPKTLTGLAVLLVEQKPDLVIIEDVGYHRKGNSASRSATFAMHVGELRGLLTGLRIPFELVDPETWMDGIVPDRPTGSSYQQTQRRKKYIQQFVEDYLGRKVTLRNADALGLFIYTETR